GLIYGLTTTAVSIAVLLTATMFYPAYINVSLIDNMNSSTYYDVDHLQRQTLDWLSYSLPLTIGLAALLLRAVVNIRMLGAMRNPSPFAFASAVNAAVFLAVFGGHPGAHMTYLFQLVTPLLIVALLPHLG